MRGNNNIYILIIISKKIKKKITHLIKKKKVKKGKKFREFQRNTFDTSTIYFTQSDMIFRYS